MWTTASVPTVPSNPSTVGIEVGLRFSTSTAGSVTGLRFYKDATNTGTHVGTLWNPAGTALATVTFTGETASGWQTMLFATPVAITTGQNYVVSVFDPNGRYPSDQNYFTTPLVNSPLTGITGVFHNTTSAFPASTYNLSNYWVDVLLDIGTTTTPLLGAFAETDTLAVALVSVAAPVPTSLAGAPNEADTLAVALTTTQAAVPTALAGSSVETDTLTVALTTMTLQVLYMRSGATLVRARLGMRTGATVTYLSPALT